MGWTIPARPTVGDTDWNAEQEAIWASLKTFVDGIESRALAHDKPVAGRARSGLSRGAQWQGFSATGDTYFYPVFYEAPFTVDELGVSVRGSGVSTNARVGLFAQHASGSFRPGAVVVQGVFDASTTGWKSLGVTQTAQQPAGWYFHACARQGANFIEIYGPDNIYQSWFDASTTEGAVRHDSSGLDLLYASGITGAFANNPTVAPAQASVVPRVSMRFGAATP